MNHKTFNKITRDIKSVKIQGAKNIAKFAFFAYSLNPSLKSKKILMSLRPTEPMLINILNHTDTLNYETVINHIDKTQEIINKITYNIIKPHTEIFTHCHSSSIIQALIYAKKHKKTFQVYNTETRPLFQGRKTAKELAQAGIKVTTFIDSATNVALTGSNKNSKVELILFGADAILKKGVINKIGSGMFAKIAKLNKIPLYILADSWKYFPRNIKIEERNFHEAWKNVPKKIKMENPAFELIPKEYITGIISEFGLLTYNQFLRKVKNRKFE